MSELEEHPPSFEQLLEAMPDGSAILDPDGTMRAVNSVLIEVTGFERAELVDQAVEMLVPPRYRELGSDARREMASQDAARLVWSDLGLSALRKDGTEFPVDFSLGSLVIDGQHWALASIRDNSVRLEAERARSEAEQHFRLAFENNMAPMLFTDLDDRITAANDAFCQMVGRTREELLGHDTTPFTHPDDAAIAEEAHSRLVRGESEQLRYIQRYLHRDGSVTYVEVSKSPARDELGRTLYFVISERDISEERTLTEQLSHQALHDPLTGLANRALFEDRLAQAYARVERHGGYGAVLLLDLDEFKGINDTHGHLVGDDLLLEVAKRLESVTRSSDTLCRFGGDEFLYLAEGLVSPDQAEHVARRLLGALAEPFNLGGMTAEQHASAGVVIWDAKDMALTEIVQAADIALYEAKHGGKDRSVIYVPGMHQQAVNRFSLAQELRKAVGTGELEMHYQPILRLKTGEVVGLEALMRWQHPTRGWVPPGVFIPIAEQSDLIVELGTFALREAARTAASWSGAVGRSPYVSVNLSAHQFLDPDLVPTIRGILAETGLEPSRLVIEITESVALLEVADTSTIMSLLDQLGVGVALDDFGTGYSSLSYLARLKPIIIKIDQSFVRPAMGNERDDRLLETIISLGHKLGMTMLAEGVETTEQLERLLQLGCEFGQGFLYSPAVPAHQLHVLLERGFESGHRAR